MQRTHHSPRFLEGSLPILVQSFRERGRGLFMLLQSHRSFDTIGEYDPITGRFETFSRRADPKRAAGQVLGVFDNIGKKRVLLYRLADGLNLEIEGKKLPLARHVIKMERVNEHSIIRVLSQGQCISDLMYETPRLLADDSALFAEEEDFDFGLFLHNVSHDVSRQTRMYHRG